MFGYHTQELVLRQQRWEAQLTWPFLTESDLRAMHTESDLVRLVQLRRGISQQSARFEVDEWMVGYRARLTAPSYVEQRSAASYPPQRPEW